MVRRTLCTMVGTILCANAVLADFPDPGPNSFGLYFLNDQDEYVNQITAEPGELAIYIVLAGPTACEIAAWEVAFDWPANGGTILAVDLAGDGINFLEPPEFAVGLSEPIPASDYVVLAELTFLYTSGDELLFYGGPTDPASIPGRPAYANVYDWIVVCYFSVDAEGQFTDENGWTTIPVAVINGEAPIPTTRHTWGCVKALYK